MSGVTHQLHKGDALEVVRHLPAARVDMIITDPPYANTGSESSRVSRSETVPRETQFYEAWVREHLAEWRRVLKPSGAAWFTVDWLGALSVEMACARLGVRRPAVGVWDRGGLGMGYAMRRTYECFVVVMMDDWKPVKRDEPDVWRVQWTPSDRTLGHSAEKPVALLKRAMTLLTDQPGVVLDPFMGSGSTGVAALELGHEFIGVEREDAYHAIAAKRLDAALAQPRLLEAIA